MSKTTLVILAAGIGSRYGGVKQLDTITPNGYTIIDFSLYDAIKAGFSKIVFVIREQIREEFTSAFEEKLKNENVEVFYVNQETDSIPDEFLPTHRKKPWGTGQALLMAKNAINENFCVINADDFYGKTAFEKMSDHLQKNDSSGHKFVMVGYRLINTLSENGSVSRGQCFVNDEDYLEQIIERTKIYRKGEDIVYVDSRGREVEISSETITSMNIWGFSPQIFGVLENGFNQFLKENSADDREEFLLPKIVNDFIKNRKGSVKVLKSDDQWMGVTYREDKPSVSEKIRELQHNGIYPKKLW
jgi:NDP-sugar pyrophosphorylase family protein